MSFVSVIPINNSPLGIKTHFARRSLDLTSHSQTVVHERPHDSTENKFVFLFFNVCLTIMFNYIIFCVHYYYCTLLSTVIQNRSRNIKYVNKQLSSSIHITSHPHKEVDNLKTNNV